LSSCTVRELFARHFLLAQHRHLERLVVLVHGVVVDGLRELRSVIVDVDDVDDDVDLAAESRLTVVRTRQCQLMAGGRLAVCRPVCCHYHERVDELVEQREMPLSNTQRAQLQHPDSAVM